MEEIIKDIQNEIAVLYLRLTFNISDEEKEKIKKDIEELEKKEKEWREIMSEAE